MWKYKFQNQESTNINILYYIYGEEQKWKANRMKILQLEKLK